MKKCQLKKEAVVIIALYRIYQITFNYFEAMIRSDTNKIVWVLDFFSLSIYLYLSI